MTEQYSHNPELTQHDFLRLKNNPEPYSRAAIAGKINYYFENVSPDSAAYRLAADIAGYLQKDITDYVRVKLAETLQNSANAPRNIILKLANDAVDEVAVPILRHSPLLNEEDLTVIVKESESTVRLMAVAERRLLSVSISSLIAEKAYENVSLALLANETAEIAAADYMKMAEKHKHSALIMKQMMCRLPLPVEAISMMEKAAMGTEQNNAKPFKLKSFMAVSPQESKTILEQITALKQDCFAADYMALATEFHHSGRINMATLLLALGCGHIGLFYACVATVTGTKYEDLGMQDTEQRDRLNALLLKAGFSNSLLPLLHWVLQGVTLKLEQGVQPCSRQMYKLMSIRLHEGARRGVNFGSTVGVPVAHMLDGLIA